MKVQDVQIGQLKFTPALMPGGVGGDTVVVTVGSGGRALGTFEVPLAQWQLVVRVVELRERVESVASVCPHKATQVALDKLVVSLR